MFRGSCPVQVEGSRICPVWLCTSSSTLSEVAWARPACSAAACVA
jgi:hypothetical protein